MFKHALFLAAFAFAGAAHADAFDLRFGYSQAEVSSEASLPEGAFPPTVVIFGHNNPKPLRSFSAQFDFLNNLGVFYQDGKADFPTSAGGASIKATTTGAEIHLTTLPWLDLFGRYNSTHYSVDYAGGSQSADDTYPSAGVRMKVSPHWGLEFIYVDSSKIFDPTLSFGLYVQF
jgi:hypothetical protein